MIKQSAFLAFLEWAGEQIVGFVGSVAGAVSGAIVPTVAVSLLILSGSAIGVGATATAKWSEPPAVADGSKSTQHPDAMPNLVVTPAVRQAWSTAHAHDSALSIVANALQVAAVLFLPGVIAVFIAVLIVQHLAGLPRASAVVVREHVLRDVA